MTKEEEELLQEEKNNQSKMTMAEFEANKKANKNLALKKAEAR